MSKLKFSIEQLSLDLKEKENKAIDMMQVALVHKDDIISISQNGIVYDNDLKTAELCVKIICCAILAKTGQSELNDILTSN